jgi:hypothetical protein
MKHNLVKIVVSYLLVLTLFAPVLQSVIGTGENQIALVNPAEEEPGQDKEKEVKELDVFFEEPGLPTLAGEAVGSQLLFNYCFITTDFLQEIILPPPEALS